MTQTSNIFKIGDRVSYRDYGEGTVIQSGSSTLVEFDIPHANFHGGMGRGRDKHCFFVTDYRLQPVNPPEDYVPTQEGDRDTDI